MTSRLTVSLALLPLVMAACGGGPAPEAPSQPVAERPAEPTATAAVATTTPTPAPAGPRYAKLRVFVASESTNQVWVLEASPKQPFAVIARIPVGALPHQLAVSPDGKWIAANNRFSNATSIIDPVALKEVVRVKVGKQPHAIAFAPDAKTLYVGHERDTYIQPIEVGTWKPLAPFVVGVPQHVLTIGTNRPTELYFSLTNTSQGDVLRAIDVVTRKVTSIKVSDVHDAYYTPDQSEIWSTSSGFLDQPSDRIVIYDPETKTVKEEIRLVGHYPFHTMKENQDGMYHLADRSLMVIADHTFPGLMWIDWRARRIGAETKLGQQPFHTTYDPESDRLLTTTNVDGQVNVIDVRTREVIQKVGVPKPHGIAAVGIP